MDPRCRQQYRDRYPLAVGYLGLGTIWLGAALAHIATITWVARLRLRKYTLGDSPEGAGGANQRVGIRRRAWFGRGLVGAGWVFIFCLFCAPVTLPLLGAITPTPILNMVVSIWNRFGVGV